MKNGNWVPISKSFLKHLPHDRAYTKMEAIYSMQCDYDDNRPVTVAGYADLWRWSRKKVALFLEHVGASIEYPENTKDKQNQKGQIRVQIRDRSGTDKGQITFIDNKVLPEEKNRKGTDKGQIRDRSGSTTIETDTKNKTKTKTFSEDSHEYSLALLLFKLIKENNPKVKAPNINTWAKDMDLTIRADERAPEDIEKVIRWCQDDDFWQGNILSVSKLRKQFDQLFMKMSKESGATDGSYASLPRNEDGETEFVQRMREERELKENGDV